MAPTASPLVSLRPGTVLHRGDGYMAVSLGSVLVDGEAYDASVQTVERGAYGQVRTTWLHRGSDGRAFILRAHSGHALYYVQEFQGGKVLSDGEDPVIVCHVGDIIEQVA